MTATDFGVISTSLATRDEAERLAEILLSERLAACVQIFAIDSRYIWKGETVSAPEQMLLVKTRTALFEAVIARIKALHSYETPEIVATPFAAGLPAYLDWITHSTGAA